MKIAKKRAITKYETVLCQDDHPQLIPLSSTKTSADKRYPERDCSPPVKKYCLFFGNRFFDIGESHDDSDDPDRKIDEKNRAPAEIVDERSADERTEHDRGGKRRRPNAERLGSFFPGRKSDRQNRHRRRIVSRPRNRLNDAKNNQRTQIPGNPARTEPKMKIPNPQR